MTAVERAYAFSSLRLEILRRISRLKTILSAGGDYGGRQALLLRASALGNVVAADFQECSLRDPFEAQADALENAAARYVSRREVLSGCSYPRYASVLLLAQTRRIRLLVSTMQPAIAAKQRDISEEEWAEHVNDMLLESRRAEIYFLEHARLAFRTREKSACTEAAQATNATSPLPLQALNQPTMETDDAESFEQTD